MKKKSIYIILSSMMCTALSIIMAGCGNSGPGQTGASLTSPVPAYASELLVFAAAGTRPAIDEVARLFEQKYGTKIAVNYGGGGEVLSNMIIAKKGDVYISPEQRFMDSAKKQGAVVDSNVIATLGFMVPVIGVKKGNPQDIKSLADLARPGIKIAMGNPETTALGVITPGILQKAGLYDAVKPNIVTNAPQVTAIVTMLKMSEVDAGFIWHYFGTSSAVDIVWIPPQYVTGIGEIQAAVSSYSQEQKTAEKFVNFLVSPEGKEVFKKNGYITDQDEAGKYWLASP